MANGKRYDDAAKRFDREQQHGPEEALGLVKSLAAAKFDETVELVVQLGVDPRKAEEMVRGTVGLPGGTGKDIRVAVFAQGEAAAAAREAGADLVGADDLAEQVEAGTHGLRSRHRHARHDGHGRPARPGARAPRPHAQPEDGHGDR